MDSDARTDHRQPDGQTREQDEDELAEPKKDDAHFELDKLAEFADLEKKYPKAAESPVNIAKPLKFSASDSIMEVELDGLVPCLRDIKTGELFDTAVHKITNRSALRQFTEKNGWFINWNEVPSDCTVCALTLKNDAVTQGLVAYRMDRVNKAVYAHWLVSAPHNRGKSRQFTGVGGHLFAIMADASMNEGGLITWMKIRKSA